MLFRDYLQGLFAGTGFTSQVYELSPFFLHKEWIMEQWEKSYYMSSIAGANNGSSLVVMSKDTFGFLPLVAVKFLTKVQRVVQNSGPSIVGTLTVFVDHSGFVCVLMETSDDEKKVAIVVANGKSTRKDRAVKKKSSAGTKFVDEVLNGDNERCVESFRMDKSVFYKLCDILQTKGLLRHTSRIKIEEQLAIFMFIIGHNLRTRAVQELFKYSGETISRHFNNVLNAIIAISLDFFKPPGSEIPPEIRDDPRFYPYFTDCVGAVTGVHFPVIVGVDEQGPFRNKNGALSQSVIAACSFDMKFHYVLAGWEGSAPDLKVLNSALTRKNKLEVPEGKYFLVDFKYANIPGFIAPYLGSQYGLLEHENRFHPQDAQELFNHRHSLLRGITDKTFGALKERFPILMSAPSYPLPTQVKLVVAACALHNYIREEKPDDNIFKMYEHEGCVSQMDESLIQPLDVQKPEMMMNEDSQMMELDVPFDAQQIENSSQLRDSIATEIWNDYIHDFPVTEG